MGYSLKDEGERFKRIYCGKNWIGRVCQHADGSYLTVIGKYILIRGQREMECFNEAVAAHMRYDEKYDAKKRAKRSPKAQYRQKAPPIIRTEPYVANVPPEKFLATCAHMRPR